jgi:hypothetical protein
MERIVPSVIIPKVPSAPMKSLVKSGPTEDFFARDRVVMTEPSAVTTVTFNTFSRIVPYLTALVPDAPVDIIPPVESYLNGDELG